MPDIRLPIPGDMPDDDEKGEKVVGKGDKSLKQIDSAIGILTQENNKQDDEWGRLGDTSYEMRYEKYADGSILVFGNSNGFGSEDMIISVNCDALATDVDFLL